MSKDSHMTVAGIYSSPVDAEQARQSIAELGIPQGRISMLAADGDSQLTLETEEFAAWFSDQQLQRFRDELTKGNVLLLIESPEPVDRIVRALDESGAQSVDVGEFVLERGSHHTLPLREEKLKINKRSRITGEAVVRKNVEEVPARVEAETTHDELDVEHVSVGEVVNERRQPWREGDVLVVPVYEEQLKVVRQLVMREQLRIRLHQVRETHTIADTVRREHAVVEDPDGTGWVNFEQQSRERDANSRNAPPD